MFLSQTETIFKDGEQEIEWPQQKPVSAQYIPGVSIIKNVCCREFCTNIHFSFYN